MTTDRLCLNCHNSFSGDSCYWCPSCGDIGPHSRLSESDREVMRRWFAGEASEAEASEVITRHIAALSEGGVSDE